jgi:ABC-type uncharacterized transport system substrate-binding protein
MRLGVPTSFAERESVVIGGLMSYAAGLSDCFRQAGVLTGRVLKGAKPDDLQGKRPAKFQLVINLKTAKALGLTVPPPMLLARTDGDNRMNRRAFITLLGCAPLASPLADRAQNSSMPEIGFLHSGSPEQNVERLAAYRKGLNQSGFVEGQNVSIEFRWATGRNDKLQELASDLVRRQVAVIATPGSTLAAVVAKAATKSIPIIFAVGAEPLRADEVIE